MKKTSEQTGRIDEINNAAHEFLKVLTNDPDLEWNMDYIDMLNAFGAEMMSCNGFNIHHLAIVTAKDSAQLDNMTGKIIDGAFWNEKKYGTCEKIPEGFFCYRASVDVNKTKHLRIWAKNKREAQDIIKNMSIHETNMFGKLTGVSKHAELL